MVCGHRTPQQLDTLTIPLCKIPDRGVLQTPSCVLVHLGKFVRAVEVVLSFSRRILFKSGYLHINYLSYDANVNCYRLYLYFS